MERVYLALGANLGDRAHNLQRAIDLLAEGGARSVAASSIYETPPMPPDQPPFLNMVVRVETALRPLALLALAKAIEHTLGRRPGPRWGPRPIDIDILFYGEERLDAPTLTIPHAALHERAFVLVPLAEITTDILPVLGVTARSLLDGVDTTGVQISAFHITLPPARPSGEAARPPRSVPRT